MKLIVLFAGIHSFGFAIFHAFFWKIFNWRKDLLSSSITTRAIIQIANLRLIYIFILVGIICFVFPEELIQTQLGRALLLGMSLFWLGRLIEQFIFLPYNRLIIHLLSVLFTIGCILFAVPLFF